MKIHMLTVDRAQFGCPNYIHTTLKSWRERVSPVIPTLFAGNNDEDYLNREVHVTFDDENLDLDGKPTRYKAGWNFFLSLCYVREGDDALMLQDDILFAVRFHDKLKQCLEAIPVDEFVLTLYCPIPLGKFPVQQLPPSTFYGSQAVFLPKTIVARLRAFVRKRFDDWDPDTPENDVIDDMMIQAFCDANNIPIFASNPSLVQHIGIGSTGLNPFDRQHSASSFFHGVQKPEKLRPVESFCTFWTQDFAEQARVLLKSLSLFHPGIPVYVICDRHSLADIYQEFPGVIAKVGADDVDVQGMRADYNSASSARRMDHNPPGIYLLKMAVMKQALQNHGNTVFVDSDLIFTMPIEPQPDCDVSMTLHWHDPVEGQRDAEYGPFNGGFVYCANRDFPDWWRNAYLNGGFADQTCLAEVPSSFDTHILPLQYNVGHWRIWNNTVGMRLDHQRARGTDVAKFCGITVTANGIYLLGKPLRFFHGRLLLSIDRLHEQNRSLKELILHCLSASGRAEHAAIYQYIMDRIGKISFKAARTNSVSVFTGNGNNYPSD
jgi:hypothetical protein